MRRALIHPALLAATLLFTAGACAAQTSSTSNTTTGDTSSVIQPAAPQPNASTPEDKTASLPAPDAKPSGATDKEKGINLSDSDVLGEVPTLANVKPGSVDDVNAIGNRKMPGDRGMGNWYSNESEIKMGKQYSMEIDHTVKMINDPVVNEYVNRITQNIVKNSDAKVPFTVKVIDSDEINAMSLPGGFMYVNSGLILAADDEAEVATVIAHEVGHVTAHHVARELTRSNYTQIAMIPLMFIGGWTGYGIYEAASIGVPLTFLKFQRGFEAQADYLGIQYAYKAGYDPAAYVAFFEKYNALIKQKPSLLSQAFASHPPTPDRIAHSQQEMQRILPPRDEYLVSTSEFQDVKARLARIENRRKVETPGKNGKPTLRRTASSSTSDSSDSKQDSSSGDTPTLHRRDD